MPKLNINLPCLTLLLATLWCVPAESQTLSWQFAKGDVFDIQIQQSTAVSTVVDRRLVEQTNQMTMDITWQVLNFQDGVATIEQTIKRVRIELSIPGEKGPSVTNYDSAEEKQKGDAKRMGASFSRLIDQPVNLSVTPQGQIRKVDIPEKTLASLREMPGSVQGRKMFDVASVREMFSQSGLQLPADSTETQWQFTRNFKIGLPQTFRLTTEYSIADTEQNPVKIDFTGELELIEDSGERPAELDFENVALTGQKSSGSLMFDSEKGNCVSSNSKTQLKTRTQYRDMEIMATVDSTVEMTFNRQ
ncbi:MAG: DUF6263 family protein [Pirellulaceae bacterium]|nr:DUF6263 family protein [Pirellulaceae bacterium]